MYIHKLLSYHADIKAYKQRQCRDRLGGGSDTEVKITYTGDEATSDEPFDHEQIVNWKFSKHRSHLTSSIRRLRPTYIIITCSTVVLYSVVGDNKPFLWSKVTL